MTPGGEEIMRIYKDGIYRPPDMIEKPEGLQIRGFGIRDGRSCSLQTALHHLVVKAAELDEYEDAPNCRAALYTSVVAIAAGYIGELGYPGYIGELGYPGHIGELGYPRTRGS